LPLPVTGGVVAPLLHRPAIDDNAFGVKKRARGTKSGQPHPRARSQKVSKPRDDRAIEVRSWNFDAADAAEQKAHPVRCHLPGAWGDEPERDVESPMKGEKDRHWSPYAVFWNSVIEWLPASTVACFVMSFVSVFLASVPALAFSRVGGLSLEAAMFAVGNSFLMYSSARINPKRVWFFAGAVLAGIAAAVWFISVSRMRAQPPGSFSLGLPVALHAMLLVLGWGAVVGLISRNRS
jgi:hypothetical protein